MTTKWTEEGKEENICKCEQINVVQKLNQKKNKKKRKFDAQYHLIYGAQRHVMYGMDGQWQRKNRFAKKFGFFNLFLNCIFFPSLWFVEKL